MASTLVIQSHRDPLPHSWLSRCLDSVESWSRDNGFAYRFIGDELFEVLPDDLHSLAESRPVIASDLARLAWLRAGLADGHDCVVWCDADFLVFDSASLQLPEDDYALGREVWVQQDEDRLRAWVKLHNACMMFRRGNSFLDFYHDTALRLLRANQGPMPPQFIGPKWLSAIHAIAQCPVLESAAMLSPLVMHDCLAGDGDALQLMRQKSKQAPTGANLSASLCTREGLDDARMDQLIDLLLARRIW